MLTRLTTLDEDVTADLLQWAGLPYKDGDSGLSDFDPRITALLPICVDLIERHSGVSIVRGQYWRWETEVRNATYFEAPIVRVAEDGATEEPVFVPGQDLVIDGITHPDDEQFTASYYLQKPEEQFRDREDPEALAPDNPIPEFGKPKKEVVNTIQKTDDHYGFISSKPLTGYLTIYYHTFPTSTPNTALALQQMLSYMYHKDPAAESTRTSNPFRDSGAALTMQPYMRPKSLAAQIFGY